MQDPIASLKPTFDRASLLADRAPQPQDHTAQAARQFEGMLMQVLFQTMRKTVEPSGLFGEEGQARSTYDYLFDQAVVDKATSTGRSWGITERLQEAWSQQGSRKSPTPLTDLGKLPIGHPTR